LNRNIKKHNNKLFRHASVVFQLIISIGFIFCTTVVINQIYFLHHTDLGFAYKNSASVYIPSNSDALENQIKQIPEVTETLSDYVALLPPGIRRSFPVEEWDDKSPDAESVDMEIIEISKAFADFYELRLAEGEMLDENDWENAVLINESAVKALGWENAVGKKVGGATVKGVLRNIYSSLPTVPVRPFMYKAPFGFAQGYSFPSTTVLFKYQEGKWDVCKDKIEQLLKKEYPDVSYYSLNNVEETYDKYLHSENALLKLLGFVSLVCVIISVFGFFSLISLSCEERRKEIAIRKINGATMRDILAMYFKTYFSLLIIGAVIAFPIGYYIMKQWLEQYIKQTSIDAWIYLSIIFVMAFVIILCVGWRVYKASVENPAEVLKTE
jgi:ABC-type antimicrobial peptide transport system permease subunit